VISTTRLDVPRARTLAAFVIALVAGVGVALIDSRPGFDDTGVTATTLFASAAVAAALAQRRIWLWAVLVGIWVPLLEIPATGSWAPLVALVFSTAGAAVGYLIARALTSR
jgi:hypothetical protein